MTIEQIGRAQEALRKLKISGLVQRILRRRTTSVTEGPHLVAKDDFSIRLADIHRSVNRVEMLVTRMYQQRGYETEGAKTDEGDDLHRVTLEACRDNQTVGTITVSLDRPEGLNAEDLYRDEVAPFRRPGRRLCEFNRLALDVDQCGKEALGSLFHLAVIFAYRIKRATDLFIEVNPRHAVFYRRKLGFKVIGEEKVCRRVNAPAILLHQELASIHEQIIRFGGLKLHQNKSFYAFFMPPWEETELVREIRDMLAKTRPLTPISAPTTHQAA